MTHYQFSQIFLGFAAKDRYTVAESLLYHLENYGVPVWYDRHDLIIGDNRQKENFLVSYSNLNLYFSILSLHSFRRYLPSTNRVFPDYFFQDFWL